MFRVLMRPTKRLRVTTLVASIWNGKLILYVWFYVLKYKIFADWMGHLDSEKLNLKRLL